MINEGRKEDGDKNETRTGSESTFPELGRRGEAENMAWILSRETLVSASSYTILLTQFTMGIFVPASWFYSMCCTESGRKIKECTMVSAEVERQT